MFEDNNDENVIKLIERKPLLKLLHLEGRDEKDFSILRTSL